MLQELACGIEMTGSGRHSRKLLNCANIRGEKFVTRLAPAKFRGALPHDLARSSPEPLK